MGYDLLVNVRAAAARDFLERAQRRLWLQHRTEGRALRNTRLGVLALCTALVACSPTAADADADVCSVAAAGDIAGAGYVENAERTASLILREDPGTVVALGDLAYYDGSAAEFRTYYRPTWGRFEAKTHAVAGNHEYRTPEAAGMEAELGETSDDNRALTLCGWQILLVNQYKGATKAVDFIHAERARHPGVPFLIAWHEPRFSSGSAHGNDPAMQPLWAAASDVQARIVLNAHDHNYERFAPMNRDGTGVSSGTRQFVSGLGGWKPKPMGTTRANSQVRFTDTPAVLFLGLSSTGGYTWTLKQWDGVVRDSGVEGP